MGERPDLIVSIDFGQTCTGVAYCNVSTGGDKVRYIQKWPGRSRANENKVPTLLAYADGESTPESWGFQAENRQDHSDEYEIREWFKIYLDEDILETLRQKASDPSKVPSIYQVEKWYADYFQCLYRWIETKLLKSEFPSRWEDARVEFIFSVPTTWKVNPTVERFRKIISMAGFGRHPTHTAVIGLTEAEAAAVHTAKDIPAIFRENEILLVCDVGGGTTDLSLFRVTGTQGFISSLKLEQIDVVFGATIGSTHLDSLFEELVLGRLEAANRTRSLGLEDLHHTAWAMRSGKEYQNAKCDYGSEEALHDIELFGVRVPKLDRAYVNEEIGLRNGDMHFRRDDLQPLFDAQISKLFDMIDSQFDRLQQKLPGEQVAHMVLSGGLGNSAYVRDRLLDRYAYGNSAQYNASKLQITVAPDPQLVVCMGNVADRVEKLRRGESVLGWRCCRLSYGVLCKVKYDAKNPEHHRKRTQKDPYDGEVYVLESIDWFIKQGEPVSSDQPIERPFQNKCLPSTPEAPNPPRVFRSDIVCSDVDPSRLPVVMDNTCRRVCKLYSDFSTLPLAEFKLKNRHLWNTGKKYHRLSYIVKVKLGPADICFGLWYDDKKLSNDQAIKVEWVAASPQPPPNISTTDSHVDCVPAATTIEPNGKKGLKQIFSKESLVTTVQA